MDVGYFLRERITFIRRFYETAAKPFEDIKRKIEAGEEPYEPPYSEDGEPPFLTEWQEADECLQVLAHACISMVSAALKLYFKAWERELGRPLDEASKREDGLINRYRVYFERNFGIRFSEGPSDLPLLEEIVLARNRFQHPDDLVSVVPTYSESDVEKLPRIFFMHETERRLFVEDGVAFAPWMLPTVSISGEQLRAAIAEVERFGEWLETQIEERILRR
jgi:hypothetical protein